MQKCYYELLSVSNTASTAEIKKAYYAAALQSHPDKLQHKHGSALTELELQRANEGFARIQQAYEVLSDQQERAWYDAHRIQILRGGSMNVDVDPDDYMAPESAGLVAASLMKYFMGGWSGYEGKNGFFEVFGDLFSRIQREENLARRDTGESSAEQVDFRSAHSSYTDVQDFYTHYFNFTSSKSFSFRDCYRLSEAPDRQTRRLMQKENDKRRSSAKKEYVETVRRLAQYVRKRDPRWKKHQEELDQRRLQNLEKEQERRRLEKQQLLKRAEEYAQTQDDLFDELAVLSHDDISESESEAESLTCYACDKSFSTQGQYDNHVRSKKHAKEVEKLRLELEAEEAMLGLSSSESESLEESKSLGTSDSIRECESTGESELGSVDEPDDVSESEVDDITRMLATKMTMPLESESDTPDDPIVIASPTKETVIEQPKTKSKKKQKKEKQDLTCAVCSTAYPTRNALFGHIKESGHAVPIASNNGKAKKKR
jgi:DnaJ family protein A protein 5